MATLLYFEDEHEPATRLALASQLQAACIATHRFPDGELKLKLPVDSAGTIDSTLVIYRSLDRPNDKLIALLLAVAEARALGQTGAAGSPYLPICGKTSPSSPGKSSARSALALSSRSLSMD